MNDIRKIMNITPSEDALQKFLYWITEREAIRKKKEAGEPKPWSDDKVMCVTKFCNVRREDDRVTKWVRENWRDPYKDHPNLWFAMLIARHFNWPPTLEVIGFPDWDEMDCECLIERLTEYREKGNKVYTGAYLVSTNGMSMDKIRYSVYHVLHYAFVGGRAPMQGETLKSYCEFLRGLNGLAGFMAGQIVADLKYVEPLLSADDWWSFAPLGPGSKRGLNRVLGRDKGTTLSEPYALKYMQRLAIVIDEQIGLKLPVHDVQNCLCEFDKYMRVKYDKGHTRSGYPGLPTDPDHNVKFDRYCDNNHWEEK